MKRFHNDVGGCRIEVPRGLISEEYSGVVEQRAAQGDALRLSTRHLSRFRLSSKSNAELGHEILGPPDGRPSGLAAIKRGLDYIVEHGPSGVQCGILEYEPKCARAKMRPACVAEARCILTRHEDGSRLWFEHETEEIEERRLAAPGRASDRHDLTRVETSVPMIDKWMRWVIGEAKLPSLEHGSKVP